MDHDGGVSAGFCIRPRCGGGGGGAKCGRWNPTAEQVKVLTELFRSGLRTPSTDEIQKISSELSYYGKIESKNVFYWFQNHKARERQKRRRVSLSLPHHHDILREEDNNIINIASAKHFVNENQVPEPQRVIETLQLFPPNPFNESESEKIRLYSNDQCKENANSFSYYITTGDKMDHPPLDLRLSFL